MRKSEREIKDFSDILELLGRCDTIRLAMNDNEYPYVVPLSFGYEVVEGQIVLYVHGAQDGKKHDLLAKNNRVCVEADLCHGFAETEHGITTAYESIIGYGRAEKASGQQAVHGLDLLLSHCNFGGYPYDHAVASMLTVYKITLSSVTGKRRVV